MFVQELSRSLPWGRTLREHDGYYEIATTNSFDLFNVASVRSQTNSRDQAFSALGCLLLAEDDDPDEEEEVSSARLAPPYANLAATGLRG